MAKPVATAMTKSAIRTRPARTTGERDAECRAPRRRSRSSAGGLYLPDANSVDQDRTLLADDRDNRSGDRTVRGQSPDSADRRSPVRVALPDPDRMGIRSPSRLNRDLAESKSAWRSMAPEPADPLDQELRGSRRNPIAARINMDPSVRDERIEPASPAPSTSSRKPAATSSAAKSKPTPGVGTKSNWQSAEEPFPEFSGAR